ncbi:Uncharacterized protein HZ326_15228 [Fusarium oxysporum f. sp. albedinis]|nr:Uncharacterized protein HZ326_15228 [Fusarium oxysporum f. sp. albedinis]
MDIINCDQGLLKMLRGINVTAGASRDANLPLIPGLNPVRWTPSRGSNKVESLRCMMPILMSYLLRKMQEFRRTLT